MNKEAKRSINILATWIGVLIAIGIMAVLMAWPTQMLWNHCLVPAIEGVNVIGFWQALGLNFLASILFKGTNTAKGKE